MKTIQQFKEEVDKLPSTDLLKHVEYYRNNGDQLFAIDETLDKGHYNTKTKLISEYGMALADNQNYEEAYPILVKAIELMNNDPYESEREEINSESTFYQHVLFHFGVTTYNTNRQSESKTTFETLLALDPTNDKYKNWLRALKIEPIDKISKILSWIFFAVVVVNIVVPDDISNNFRSIYYPTLLFFALSYLVIQGLKWNIKNKLKNTSANKR